MGIRSTYRKCYIWIMHLKKILMSRITKLLESNYNYDTYVILSH